MRKQDYLLSLIQALDTNEKRYFKLQNKLQKGHKKYDVLFDELSTLNTYDAKALAKKLKKTGTQLSSEKEYLEKILMRSLRNFHEGATKRIELTNTITEVEILYSKRQYATCLQLCEKALKATLENELFEFALIFIRLHNHSYQHVKNNMFDLGKQQLEFDILKKMENETQYRFLLATLGLELNSVAQPSAKIKHEFKEKMNVPLLSNESEALSIKAKIVYNRLWADYYRLVAHDGEKTLIHAHRTAEILEQNPIMLNAQLRSYLTNLQIITATCALMGNYDGAKDAIRKREQLLQNKKLQIGQGIKNEVNENIVYETANLLFLQKKFADLISHLTSPHAIKIQQALEPGFQYSLNFMLATAYLLTGHAEKALPLCNNLLDEWPAHAVSYEIYNYHLYLLIQYTVGNTAIMQHLLQNYTRWCQKNNLSGKQYKDFKLLLTQLTKAANTAARNEAIKNYRSQLAKGTDEERYLAENMQIEEWLKLISR